MIIFFPNNHKVQVLEVSTKLQLAEYIKNAQKGQLVVVNYGSYKYGIFHLQSSHLMRNQCLSLHYHVTSLS